MMALRALAAALALTATAPAQSAEPCRQALALGLDVSGSVDAAEYRLQLEGLAAALGDSSVRRAFLEYPEAPVRFMVFEWSGLRVQRRLVDWQTIATPAQLDGIARRLRGTRVPARVSGQASTALAAAMRHGAQAALSQGCWRAVLDISGDGPGNIGAHPVDLSRDTLGDVTINALVIGPQNRANTTKNLANVKTLEDYYRSFVIRGPGAFVESAQDYTDFARAMQRKLVRELAAPALSRNEAVRYAQ